MSLANIQQAFHSAVYGADDAQLSAFILGNAAFSAAERIAVYRNNTLGTLQEVVKSRYPVCKQLVGERYFDQLAKHFVASKPSDNANLDVYAEDFAGCLDELIQHRPELSQLDYLPDMARLEWALHSSYYAIHRTHFDFAGFAALEPQQQAKVSFMLAADICLLNSDYPVYSIWQQHQSGQSEAHAFAATEDYGFMAIVRDQFKPVPIPIAADLYRLLQAIQHQSSLAELAEWLTSSPVSIQALIQQGWIVAYKTGETC